MNRVLHRLGSARPKFPSCKRVSCCFHPIRQIVESEKFIRELIHDRVRLLFGGFGFKNIPVKKLFYGRLTERTLRLRPYRRIVNTMPFHTLRHTNTLRKPAANACCRSNFRIIPSKGLLRSLCIENERPVYSN